MNRTLLSLKTTTVPPSRWQQLITWLQNSRIAQLIENICSTGTSGINDEVLISNIRMTNTLSLSIGAAMFVITPVVYLLTRNMFVLISVIIEFSLNAAVILINRARRPVAASLTLYLLQCIAVSFFCLLFGGVIQLQFMIVFVISIVCLIFADRRLRKWCFIAAGVTLVVVQGGYYFRFVHYIPVDRDAGYIIQSMAIMGVLFMIAVVSRPYVNSNDVKYELIKANRFKQLFLAQVTHELRTPLNTIYLCGQLMKRDMKLNEQLRPIESMVDQILYACNNASLNINNVLDLAQIEAGKMMSVRENTFAVNDFFEKIMEGSKVIAKVRAIRLKLHIEDMPEAIICDPLQLHHVVTNLVANAIKYAAKSSTVYLNVKGAGDKWVVQVKNSGPEISSEKLPMIFDLFVTDKSVSTEGNGLGLFIVKNKAEQALGGVVEVESHNQTTVFTVHLPLCVGRPEDVAQDDAEDRYDLGNIDVLVADDNTMNAILMAKHLDASGCKVTLAADGGEVMEKMEGFAAGGRLPDIIIVDQQMPVLNGIQTTALLKKDSRFKSIPVVFVTADAYEAHQQMKDVGAADILVKPVKREDLLKVLSKHIKHSGELLQE